VKRQFGVEIRDFITGDVRITHKVGGDRPVRPSVKDEQFEQLLDHLHRTIAAAQADGDIRHLRLFQRDLVMLCCLRFLGSRAGGVLSINTDSFLANPLAPEFGKYGTVQTWEKGTCGSGSRAHPVEIDDPRLPPILGWYEKEVRPHFLSVERP